MFQQRVIADRYELTTPIGQGGMGVVVRGYDRRLDRRIAVKLMAKENLHATDTGATVLVERFLRETRMTARVEHPGVPAVYDAGIDGDDLYLVMQFVDGQELGGLLAQRGPLPITAAAAIGAQLASILAAAHACFLVHRDLKPANIMVTPDGTVKLLDFGIAVLLDPSVPRLTRSHETLGTASYMAPELWAGEDVTSRTDLYALGCLLFEMLIGRPPFTGSRPESLLYQHLHTAPPALEELLDDVPAPLGALITGLLGKSPADRPATAGDVRTRLAPYLPAPQAVDAPDAGGEHDPTRPYRHPFAPSAPADRTRIDPGPGRGSAPAETGPDTPVHPPAPLDPGDIRDDVDRLVQDQRFTQAGDVLSDALDHPDGLPDGTRLEFAHMRADAWFNARRVDQAEQEYQRILPLLIEHCGEGSEDVLDCRDALAGCLVDLDRHTEAISVMLDLLDGYRALGQEESEDALELNYGIARSQAATGDLGGARERLHDLHADARRVLGPGDPLTVRAGTTLQRLNGD